MYLLLFCIHQLIENKKIFTKQKIHFQEKCVYYSILCRNLFPYLHPTTSIINHNELALRHITAITVVRQAVMVFALNSIFGIVSTEWKKSIEKPELRPITHVRSLQ